MFSGTSEPKVRPFHTLLGVLLPQKSLVAPRSWCDNHITISSCHQPISGLCSAWYPSQKTKSGICFLLIPECRRGMTEWNACWTGVFKWEQTLMYKAKCHGSLACGSLRSAIAITISRTQGLSILSAVCIHSITDRNDSPTYSKYGGNLQACHTVLSSSNVVLGWWTSLTHSSTQPAVRRLRHRCLLLVILAFCQ